MYNPRLLKTYTLDKNMTANPISQALQQYSVKTIWGASIPMDISQTKAAIPAHKKKRNTL